MTSLTKVKKGRLATAGHPFLTAETFVLPSTPVGESTTSARSGCR